MRGLGVVMGMSLRDLAAAAVVEDDEERAAVDDQRRLLALRAFGDLLKCLFDDWGVEVREAFTPELFTGADGMLYVCSEVDGVHFVARLGDCVVAVLMSDCQDCGHRRWSKSFDDLASLGRVLAGKLEPAYHECPGRLHEWLIDSPRRRELEAAAVEGRRGRPTVTLKLSDPALRIARAIEQMVKEARR